MAGGMWDPKKKRLVASIVALILVLAMVVPSVLTLILGWA